MPIDAVIFDFGKVLGLPPRDQDFETLRAASGISAADFLPTFWRRRDQYDRGALDGAAFWGLIAHDAGVSYTPQQIEKLIALDIQLWIRPHPVMLEWARLLHERGLKTAVLSNMPCDHARNLRQNVKWLETFDYLCFSSELKVGKPEAAIYRACLEGLHVSAAQALFLDDHEIHVQGGRAVGLNALVFSSVEQLAKDLEPFGLEESWAEAEKKEAGDAEKQETGDRSQESESPIRRSRQ